MLKCWRRRLTFAMTCLILDTAFDREGEFILWAQNLKSVSGGRIHIHEVHGQASMVHLELGNESGGYSIQTHAPVQLKAVPSSEVHSPLPNRLFTPSDSKTQIKAPLGRHDIVVV